MQDLKTNLQNSAERMLSKHKQTGGNYFRELETPLLLQFPLTDLYM